MNPNTQQEIIVLGGGCFWCTEAVFAMIKGAESVTPGYAGGVSSNPTYDDVSSGTTGHAEVVKILYDKEVTNIQDILTVFFATHDPTTLNRQGADVGTQYRSCIFYTTKEQKEIAESMIQEINASSDKGELVTTEVKQLDIFFEAEEYHRNYFSRNKEAMYCQLVIHPKLQKVQEKFAELLKNKYV